MQTVKQTLCELILAIGSAGIISCGPMQPTIVPNRIVEQSQKKALDEVIKLSISGEYTKVIGFFEQRIQYMNRKREIQLNSHHQANQTLDLPNPSFTLSEQTLLAIAQARTRAYKASEDQFRHIMSQFRDKPHLVEEVQKDLAPYFASKEYEKSEKLLIWASGSHPELTAVVAFMYLAKKDYINSAAWLKKAVPKFEENTVNQYRDSFAQLVAHARQEHDDVTTLAYAKVLGATYNAKAKPSEFPNSCTQIQAKRRAICKILAFVCQKEENEHDAAKKKDYESIILETAKILAESYPIEKIHSIE